MRSSTGQHWIALDHVRALAAFLVFAWHFTHGLTGTPSSFAGAPIVFPLALADEGHTGVALFMTLSGYLFAKILDRRQLDFRSFLMSRAIRLLPMMAVAIFVAETVSVAIGGGRPDFALAYSRVMAGFFGIGGPLVNGLWSVVVEAHFYILLPVLLAIARRWRFGLMAGVCLAIALRLILWWHTGSIQHAAYYTLFGRFDQFALGMSGFYFRDTFRKKHVLALAIAVSFTAFYAWFDATGGWYGPNGADGDGPIWTVLPTIEGTAYAALIAWYDASFAPTNRGLSALLGQIGRYSYSIYLLHFFVVFRMSSWIDEHVMSLANFYVALAWAAVCFVVMLPVGWACYVCVEAPLMRRRRSYLRQPEAILPANAATA